MRKYRQLFTSSKASTSNLFFKRCLLSKLELIACNWQLVSGPLSLFDRNLRVCEAKLCTMEKMKTNPVQRQHFFRLLVRSTKFDSFLVDWENIKLWQFELEEPRAMFPVTAREKVTSIVLLSVGKVGRVIAFLWRSLDVVWLWLDVGKSVDETLPFQDFALECNTFDGTRPVLVVLALYISPKLEIDSLLCDEGKNLGSRLLEPATNFRWSFKGMEFLATVHLINDLVTNVITLSTVRYLI